MEAIRQELSLEQKIAQMIMVRASGHSLDHQRLYPQWELSNSELEELITAYGIGGIILVGGTAKEVEQRTRHWQSLATVPLFIAADVEEGVGQRFAGGTKFPPPMALFAIWQQSPATAIALAEAMGRITALEALTIGVNWLLAPVADVNSNPLNPVINVRSFGEIPQAVKVLSGAFLKGAQQFPVLTCAKHFPGHGDTHLDSHLHTPIIENDLSYFEEIALPPFQALIEGGVDGVMSAHVLALAWDAENIATFSPRILTHLLQQTLQFHGLVVTDALVMAGVGALDPATVAIKAIQAGADILLMPREAITSIQAIHHAVTEGIIPVERIERSWQKITTAKLRVQQGLSCQWQFADLGRREHQQVSAAIADQSLSYYLPNHQPVPIDDCLIIYCSDHPHPSEGQNAIAQYTCAPRLLTYLNISDLPPVCLHISSRGYPFQGSSLWHTAIASFVKELVSQQKLRLVTLYGSPYNLPRLKALLPPSLPWGFAYTELAHHYLLNKLVAR